MGNTKCARSVGPLMPSSQSCGKPKSGPWMPDPQAHNSAMLPTVSNPLADLLPGCYNADFAPGLDPRAVEHSQAVGRSNLWCAAPLGS